MSTFGFLFGSMLSELVLRHTDNLSRILQNKTCSAAEGQQIARLVVDTLLTVRNDESFGLFWQKLISFSQPLDIEPRLPRHRKVPRKLDTGSTESYYHETPKAYYKQEYFEGVDLAINTIRDRFEQPGYEIYQNLEKLLLKAATGKDFKQEFDFVTTFYHNDLQPDNLQAQLITFKIDFLENLEIHLALPYLI